MANGISRIIRIVSVKIVRIAVTKVVSVKSPTSLIAVYSRKRSLTRNQHIWGV